MRYSFASSHKSKKKKKKSLGLKKKQYALYCWTFFAVNSGSLNLPFSERSRKAETQGVNRLGGISYLLGCCPSCTQTILWVSSPCWISVFLVLFLFFSLVEPCGLEEGDCTILPCTEQFSSNVLWTIVRCGSLVSGDGNNGVWGPLCCLTWLQMIVALDKQFFPSTLISYQK